ncbi:MAG: carbamate kinase [Gammaproteobacteria bacterium]|nr:carbamate kinase [Gammaproteobacteria bacterium]
MTRRPLLIAALGGNALLERGESPDAETQRGNVRRAVTALAQLAGGRDLVVTHGNGPQIGLLAMQSEALGTVPAYPLDILDAETEGMLGYLIEQELANRLPRRQVATLLTRVEVAADDPAFGAPAKPIGPIYDAERARELERTRGWHMAEESAGFRRVVASPRPRRILELDTIRLLVDAGHVVVCAGGGGIPVMVDDAGDVRGAEAVIDKDHVSALLARELAADMLLLLTDQPAVWSTWPPEGGRAIRSASPEAMRRLRFEAGSMAPKVEAACTFAEQTGRSAAIGALEDAARIASGEAGTLIRTSAALTYYDAEPAPNVRRRR